MQQAGKNEILRSLEKGVTTKEKEKGKLHAVWKGSFDWKICETAEFAYQKLVYMQNNPCNGKWKLADDISKYEHSSAKYYITGKHAGYIVTDIAAIFGEKYAVEKLATHTDPMKVVGENEK